jgi:predicted O-methyltransferase YrrM
VNSVLERILETQQVSDGYRNLPLSHPDFPALPVAVTPEEGGLIQRIVADLRPRLSIEIGCAYGVSSLYVCEALAWLPDASRRHIVLDPFQSTQWRGIGVRNIREAGFGALLDFREERSEFALPALASEGTAIQFALVDGWHTFDQVMVEFYFLNRMLDVGGVLLFDDADRRSVNRVIRHALTYSAYRVYAAGGSPPATRRSTLGRIRRSLASVPAAGAIVRPDVLHRDWDLGILGSCVALQKIAPDVRSSGWDRAF